MILKISHTRGKDILIEYKRDNYYIQLEDEVRNKLFRAGFKGNVLYIEVYNDDFNKEDIKYVI